MPTRNHLIKLQILIFSGAIGWLLYFENAWNSLTVLTPPHLLKQCNLINEQPNHLLSIIMKLVRKTTFYVAFLKFFSYCTKIKLNIFSMWKLERQHSNLSYTGTIRKADRIDSNKILNRSVSVTLNDDTSLLHNKH